MRKITPQTANDPSPKWPWIIFTIFIWVFGGGCPAALGQNQEGPTFTLGSGTGLATISAPDGTTIYAEIANTPDKRAQGLMFRTSMAPDHGMIFTFPELGHWTFWMKNTKMSLDIIWLGEKGHILHIESEVPICTRTDDGCPRYYSHKKSRYVLEIKAGMAKKFGLKTGAHLTLSFPNNTLPY